MILRLFCAVGCLLLIERISADELPVPPLPYQPEHQLEPQQPQHPQPHHGKFGSKDEYGNVDHLRQHFQDKIEIQNDTFDPNHSRFYYFNLHNTNGDKWIDGLELMKGITHSHAGDPMPDPMTEEEIEMMVDSVLREFDTDGDGLVDYSEYLRGTAETGAPNK